MTCTAQTEVTLLCTRLNDSSWTWTLHDITNAKAMETGTAASLSACRDAGIERGWAPTPAWTKAFKSAAKKYGERV